MSLQRISMPSGAVTRALPAALPAALPVALMVAILACGGLTACSDGGSDGQGGSSSPGVVVRPGDSLLDHLEAARVVRYPDSSLPPDVAALAGGTIRVRRTVPALAWENVPILPAGWESILEANGNPVVRYAPSPLPLAEGGKRPVPLIAGVPAPEWNMDSDEPMPERLAVWREREQLILATGVDDGLLRDIGLEGSVLAFSEFAGCDRGALVTGHAPHAAELATQQELDGVVRASLLLAAPGVLELNVAELVAQRLEFAVGVIDSGWELVQGLVRSVQGRGDGVTFAVEIVGHEAQDSTPVRVWEGTLGATDVGARWLEASVDLSPWSGKACTVRLVSEPGPSGDALFDYGMWAGLRFRGKPLHRPSRPHVVLIDIDTLRADRLGSHGSELGLTPELDAWAARSAMVFPDAVATAPWTLPSTVSMFTGLSVHQHGITTKSTAMGSGADTLVTYLRDAGYETRGIATGGYLDPTYGFDLGFDIYETREPKNIDWSTALDFVRARDSERPFFLFLHSYFVHAPYEYVPGDVDPDYDGPLRGVVVDRHTVFDPWHDGQLELSAADRTYVEDLYDGLVRSMDRTVGDFLEQLQAAVGDDELMIVLTSDHGESFLEHDLYGHGRSLWHEVLRVPLMISFPDGAPGVSEVPASGLDLLPTVLETVGLPVPEGLAGRALRVARGPSVRYAQYGSHLRSVMNEGYKLIESPGSSDGPTYLFDLARDAGEQHDLAAADRDRVELLRKRLAWFLATYPADLEGNTSASIGDSGVLEELKALGYVGR